MPEHLKGDEAMQVSPRDQQERGHWGRQISQAVNAAAGPDRPLDAGGPLGRWVRAVPAAAARSHGPRSFGPTTVRVAQELAQLFPCRPGIESWCGVPGCRSGRWSTTWGCCGRPGCSRTSCGHLGSFAGQTSMYATTTTVIWGSKVVSPGESVVMVRGTLGTALGSDHAAEAGAGSGQFVFEFGDSLSELFVLGGRLSLCC